MKKLIWLILICNSAELKCQEDLADTISDLCKVNPKPYEIAYLFLGVDFRNDFLLPVPEYSTCEFLDGILARYKFNRFSLRLNASFSMNNTNSAYVYNYYGNVRSKNYRIGVGGQFTPFTKKEWVYGYLDLNCRRKRESGLIIDENSNYTAFNHYDSKITGLDMILGVGTKLKIYRNFYFSGELGYNYYIAKNNTKINNIRTQDMSYQSGSFTFRTVLSRLYLSLIF
jgi:hypothetical protein